MGTTQAPTAGFEALPQDIISNLEHLILFIIILLYSKFIILREKKNNWDWFIWAGMVCYK